MRNLYLLSEEYRKQYYHHEKQYGQKGLFYAHELTKFLKDCEDNGEVDDVLLMMRLLEAGVMVGRKLHNEESPEDREVRSGLVELDPNVEEFNPIGFQNFIDDYKPQIKKMVTGADVQKLGDTAHEGRIYTAIVDAIAFGYGLRATEDLSDQGREWFNDDGSEK